MSEFDIARWRKTCKQYMFDWRRICKLRILIISVRSINAEAEVSVIGVVEVVTAEVFLRQKSI